MYTSIDLSDMKKDQLKSIENNSLIIRFRVNNFVMAGLADNLRVLKTRRPSRMRR